VKTIFLFILLAWPVVATERRVVAERYWHTFSAAHPVLLTVKPGDRIVTKTVDSAGFDLTGVRRTVTHGNPLTGPFFVKGAEAGDALEVRIDRIRLNRTTGYTGYQVGLKETPPVGKPGADIVYKGYDYLVPWTIGLKRGVVRTGRLEFAAQPMLGCIGVAPEEDYSPRSGPAGYWGGNLDYNLIREGAIVLLPVFHSGRSAVFRRWACAARGWGGGRVGSGDVARRRGYRGTAERAEADRAARGDRSMDRVSGREKGATLNQTLEIATRDMLRWLIDEQGLSRQEAHLLIGMRARYDLITLGGSVGLRIARRDLPRNQRKTWSR
jgi:amidase